MNLLKTLIFGLLLTLLTNAASFAGTARVPATMSLPESFVQELITRSLPLEFKLNSNNLLGSVSVDKISNLQLHKGKLSGHATLSGHGLNIVTEVAGHNLRMKIGTLSMAFQCDVTTRFDARQQILYLRPIITELQSTDKTKTEFASTIALLFNNRELPLQIKKLKPVVADAGDKNLNISLHIKDIQLHPDKILLIATPRLSVTTDNKKS
ncbi:MAG: hypothetical protein ABFR63_10205 [Thermodesulfobacteriota bacterium]